MASASASSSEDFLSRPYAHRPAAAAATPDPITHALPQTTCTSICISSKKPPPPIQTILQLAEDEVWALRKQDLRNYFLSLQAYALNPYPLGPLTPPPAVLETVESKPSKPADLPPLLRLPLEIRRLIYTQLLPTPCSTPIRGPHPRQLQNHVHLSQPIPPNLLRLNHQIRSEALSVLYGCPSQIVYIKIDYNVVCSPMDLSTHHKAIGSQSH
jgi:hypothetical protein